MATQNATFLNKSFNIDFTTRRCGIFGNLADEKLTQLAKIARAKSFQPEEYIVKQGNDPDNLYILRRGVAKMVKYKDTVMVSA